jgi:hypothetical protein
MASLWLAIGRGQQHFAPAVRSLAAWGIQISIIDPNYVKMTALQPEDVFLIPYIWDVLQMQPTWQDPGWLLVGHTYREGIVSYHLEMGAGKLSDQQRQAAEVCQDYFHRKSVQGLADVRGVTGVTGVTDDAGTANLVLEVLRQLCLILLSGRVPMHPILVWLRLNNYSTHALEQAIPLAVEQALQLCQRIVQMIQEACLV